MGLQLTVINSNNPKYRKALTVWTANEWSLESYLYEITLSVVATARKSPRERRLNAKTVHAVAPGIGWNLTGGWAPWGDVSHSTSDPSSHVTTSRSAPTIHKLNVYTWNHESASRGQWSQESTRQTSLRRSELLPWASICVQHWGTTNRNFIGPMPNRAFGEYLCSFKSHSTYNRSFRWWVFPANHLAMGPI